MIPGQLIALITFPGVVIHEIAHRFFADLLGVPVYKIKYFQISKDAAGYVEHGEIKTTWQAFWICVGPFIINSLLCMVLTLPFAYYWLLLDAKDPNPVVYFMGWLGLSIGVHAFPSNVDMKSFSHHAFKLSSNIIVKVFAVLLQILVFLSNLLRFFWFDLFYAMGISVIIPLLIK
jgi:hypothetical protein